jgi:hypothetical protein
LPDRHVDRSDVVQPLVVTKSRVASARGSITNTKTLNCDRDTILACSIADRSLIVCERVVQVVVCNGNDSEGEWKRKPSRLEESKTSLSVLETPVKPMCVHERYKTQMPQIINLVREPPVVLSIAFHSVCQTSQLAVKQSHAKSPCLTDERRYAPKKQTSRIFRRK